MTRFDRSLCACRHLHGQVRWKAFTASQNKFSLVLSGSFWMYLVMTSIACTPFESVGGHERVCAGKAGPTLKALKTTPIQTPCSYARAKLASVFTVGSCDWHTDKALPSTLGSPRSACAAGPRAQMSVNNARRLILKPTSIRLRLSQLLTAFIGATFFFANTAVILVSGLAPNGSQPKFRNLPALSFHQVTERAEAFHAHKQFRARRTYF